jgi:hypothetical protein
MLVMLCTSINKKIRFFINILFQIRKRFVKSSAHNNKIINVVKKNNSGKKKIKSVEKEYSMSVKLNILKNKF